MTQVNPHGRSAMQTAAATVDLAGIRSAISRMVADVAGVDPEGLTPSTTLDTIGIDSLLIVEVVVAIEKEFGVKIPPSAFRKDIFTVGRTCEVLGDFVAGGLAAGPARA
jgi:acyl carrier protein